MGNITVLDILHTIGGLLYPIALAIATGAVPVPSKYAWAVSTLGYIMRSPVVLGMVGIQAPPAQLVALPAPTSEPPAAPKA